MPLMAQSQKPFHFIIDGWLQVASDEELHLIAAFQ